MKNFRIFEEDDCAPDARQYFEARFEQLIGLPFDAWKKEAVKVNDDDGYTVIYDREEIRVWCDAGDQTWKVDVLLDKANAVDWVGRLSLLQSNVGYQPGPINPIALLGLVGEAAEVVAETIFQAPDRYPELVAQNVVNMGEIADRLKKDIRDKKLGYDVEVYTDHEDDAKLDMEMADQFYYFNALAINRGKPLWYYAMLSYWKVMKKKPIYIGKPDTDIVQ